MNKIKQSSKRKREALSIYELRILKITLDYYIKMGSIHPSKQRSNLVVAPDFLNEMKTLQAKIERMTKRD
jgi:hypothetical protein